MKSIRMSAWLRWASGLAMMWLLGSSASATTVVPPEFDQLVNESDYIIRAVVKSVESEARPAPNNGRKFITKVALEVREVIAGTPPAEVVLEMLGGKIGDEEMVVQGAPRFTVGDEDILFVRGNGHTIVPLVAMMHGRYPILREAGSGRRYVARENKTPLSETAQVAQPMSEHGAVVSQQAARVAAPALAPEDFIKQVKAAVNPRYVREKP